MNRLDNPADSYYVAIDTETHLIGKGSAVPKLVCLSYAEDDGSKGLLVDKKEIYEYVCGKISDGAIIWGANIAFDEAVLYRALPHIYPVLADAHEAKQINCIQIRQGLIDLATTGKLAYRYSLNNLGVSYGMVDRSADKEGTDIWRLRYSELDGCPLSAWPEKAASYALEDAVETLAVARAQTSLILSQGEPYQDITCSFHTAAAFALMLVKARGLLVDGHRVKSLEANLEKLLSKERMRPLFAAGILSPEVPPRPYKNGRGWTRGTPEKKNTKVLRAYVERCCVAARIEPLETAGEKVSTSAQMLTMLPPDPLLDLYRDREKVNKLRTTYLPHLKEGIVYASFNPLVSTGRVSSRSDSLLPSMNMQNQPRISGALSIRETMVPRKGFLFLSIDYSSLELCSCAYTVKEIVGYSHLLDRINNGVDSHAFLGAQIANRWDREFQGICEKAKAVSLVDVYEQFLLLKSVDRKTFKHFRKFAKPTGLGYPGGLGVDKFMEFARTTYGVDVTRERAAELKEMWFLVCPEMHEYFAWVNAQHDPYRSGELHYFSPLGMRRGGASYCAVANGKALQTSSAEGVKIALINVSNACHDPRKGSILMDSYIVNDIHDELLIEVPEDDLTHERSKEAQKIMEDSMRDFLPGVTISTEAALMRRWYKEAEAVYDATGRLIPWEPTPTNL